VAGDGGQATGGEEPHECREGVGGGEHGVDQERVWDGAIKSGGGVSCGRAVSDEFHTGQGGECQDSGRTAAEGLIGAQARMFQHMEAGVSSEA